MQQLVLAATDMELGTCWIGGFDETKVKKALGVPENIKVVAMTPVGYPADNEGLGDKLRKTLLKGGKRKPLAEIIHQEKW
jgi:nitroreductase